jgi:hypothetical protein
VHPIAMRLHLLDELALVAAAIHKMPDPAQQSHQQCLKA